MKFKFLPATLPTNLDTPPSELTVVNTFICPLEPLGKVTFCVPALLTLMYVIGVVKSTVPVPLIT